MRVQRLAPHAEPGRERGQRHCVGARPRRRAPPLLRSPLARSRPTPAAMSAAPEPEPSAVVRRAPRLARVGIEFEPVASQRELHHLLIGQLEGLRMVRSPADTVRAERRRRGARRACAAPPACSASRSTIVVTFRWTAGRSASSSSGAARRYGGPPSRSGNAQWSSGHGDVGPACDRARPTAARWCGEAARRRGSTPRAGGGIPDRRAPPVGEPRRVAGERGDANTGHVDRRRRAPATRPRDRRRRCRSRRPARTGPRSSATTCCA